MNRSELLDEIERILDKDNGHGLYESSYKIGQLSMLVEIERLRDLDKRTTKKG